MSAHTRLALLGGEKIRRRPFAGHPVLGKEERLQVNEVLKSGVMSGFVASAGEPFLGGPKVRLLEEKFQKMFHVQYAIAVNSATAGLHAAIAAAGVGPGDEVIVTPYTMSASASAILMAQGIPVFADIDEETFCLDPKSVERKITPRTKAIVVVHLFGQAADMDAFMRLGRKHKLAVIEDAAQAPGAVYKKKYVGTMGAAGIFSLNQHKTITTGEGGLVVTNDLKTAQKVRLIRNHGEVVVAQMNFTDIANTLGWNYRMTELEAAVGVAQADKLDFLTKYRIELAEYLTKQLNKAKYPGMQCPTVRSWNRHVYFSYPLKFNSPAAGIKRKTLVAALRAEGMPMGEGYVRPIYWEPMYQKQICYGTKGYPFKSPLYKGKVDYSYGICPVAERMHTQELMSTGLCRFPLKKKDIDDLIKSFDKVFNSLSELKSYEKKITV